MPRIYIMMTRLLLTGIMLFYCCPAFAGQCPVKMEDISQIIEATGNSGVLTLTDPDSEEKIRRYTQQQDDGSIVIVEQKHCQIYNLTVTLLLPEGVSIDTAPRKLAGIVEQTPIWKKFFNDLRGEKILKKEFSSTRFQSYFARQKIFCYSLDDLISSRTESSEALIKVVNFEEPDILPVSLIISFYIGAGGL